MNLMHRTQSFQSIKDVLIDNESKKLKIETEIKYVNNLSKTILDIYPNSPILNIIAVKLHSLANQMIGSENDAITVAKTFLAEEDAMVRLYRLILLVDNEDILRNCAYCFAVICKKGNLAYTDLCKEKLAKSALDKLEKYKGLNQVIAQSLSFIKTINDSQLTL